MRRLIAITALAFVVLVAGGAAAGTFAVTLVSQTTNTITLGWTAQPGYGYLFSSAGVLRSRSNDPARTSVKFSKVTPASYDVDVMAKGNRGMYQPGAPPPPPPPTVSVTQTIVNGSTIANITGWRAVYDANGDGVEDDPGSIRFLVDGVQILSEVNAPFGDTFATGSPSVAAGQHVFRVDAVNGSGSVVASNTVTATVGSPSPPPPSGCALPAFPDASCTGVPAGTALTASGTITVTTAGTVVDGRDVTGQIIVSAPNVTIRNTRIRGRTMYLIDNNSTGLVVEDSELINLPASGQNNCHVGIGDANFTIRRSEITGCENAGNFGGDNIVFTDNYVHDLDTTGPSYVWGNSPHTDGIQMSPGADNIVVQHNTIGPVGAVVGVGGTSAIIMGVNGAQQNVRIEDNYLDGRNSSYALYLPRQPSTVYVNRNHMLKGYGYTACAKVGVTVVEFNGNVDAISGAAVAPDNGSDGGCTN